MPANGPLIERLVDTNPLPAFVALEDGTIKAANAAMLKAAGQPKLVELDRSLFGLGIFHNRAELRGFLQSFKDSSGPRRLVLPVGRLGVNKQSIILYASRVEWQRQPALYGVLSKLKPSELFSLEDDSRHVIALLDRLPFAALTIATDGTISLMNAALRADLNRREGTTGLHLLDLDVETDRTALTRHVEQAYAQGLTTYETSLQRSDGSLLPARITVTPLQHANPVSGLLVTVVDITEQRKSQRKQQALELENATLVTQLERRSILVSEKFDAAPEQYRIITQSPQYKHILHQVRQVAHTDSTVLITGETGTGKELLARAVHSQSGRASRPLVILNCGALPADLIESELFGYRKGAFTGARTDHLGRFELADEATLFLDEIGEMPLALQTRLLRVLQDGEFTPLGARTSVQTDVRIIAATNQDLREQVEQGTFRSDLYFRLNVFPIHSIPLRERREDIGTLVMHFIKKYLPDDSELPTLQDRDLQLLQELPFPGNIRELENMIQRALILSTGPYLNLDFATRRASAGPRSTPATANGRSTDVNEVLPFDEMQRRHIQSVLTLTGGKVSGQGGAAELLGLNPQTLFSKMRKLGISRSRG
ncbi:Anaerobic nitric oxide reductase transcription regulator NorR [Neolewinella maritima]|uniref:Anaerobic nitric oxide reductase transcription regulator NorR n=1 Tax=Neolewinella maritima TaxID=1383882 RepID=A0ABM9AZX9_9BACT|nr:sigma 54-interacting transcriptional regulator [Neolewinella maritima]CAH0999775.1 Anaerobic nitric oxide reductase transcription regulator NorR [Neolewinella maritima]